MTPQELFLDFLKNTPDALKKFLAVIVQFYALQSETTKPTGTAPKVTYLRPGNKPQLITVEITPDELDAMMNDRADARVKALALEYCKGFLTGFMMRGI